METKELTLGQRLTADTPTFFKKVDLVGVGIAGIGTSLLTVTTIPVWIAPVLIAVGGTLTILSKFAVKDTSVLANPNATIADYSAVLQDLPNQFEQLHAGIANTVAAIQAGQVQPAQPPVATPIVDKPVDIPVAPIQAIEQAVVGAGLAQTAPSNPGLPTTPLNPNVSPLN